MNILCLGISHRNSPIDIRERFSLSAPEQEELLKEIMRLSWTKETFVLSTCNRTEIYVHFEDHQDPFNEILDILFLVKNISSRGISLRHFYTLLNDRAIKHLLKVAVGLDSLVIGEKQILGQVKVAIELARQHSSLGRCFNILTNLAIEAGKKARRETNIGKGGSSISWAAVTLVEKIYESLSGRSVLIVGAGKMSELTAKQLQGKNIKDIFVMNRTYEHAEQLADRVNGVVLQLSQLEDVLCQVDVCFSSSGAPYYMIKEEMIRNVLIRRPANPLILVDISFPRNVEPSISVLKGVELYSIDDLEKITQVIMKQRLAAKPAVKQIISDKTSEFYGKMNRLQNYNMAVPN